MGVYKQITIEIHCDGCGKWIGEYDEDSRQHSEAEEKHYITVQCHCSEYLCVFCQQKDYVCPCNEEYSVDEMPLYAQEDD